MKVLIIGTGGQVATELVRTAPSEASFEALGRSRFDLTKPDACAETIRAVDADVIINAAAYTAVDQAETDEATAKLVNADAPAAMARVAAEKGIAFLHVSTDYVYDGSGVRPFVPESPTGPLGAYGRTKLAGDLGVIAAGGAHAILRTSWVFSAHGNNFVKTMLGLGRERDSLNVVDDQIGAPTPAAAIARALWCMAQRFHQTPRDATTSLSGIYHFAGSPDTSWAGFAREIFQRSNTACDVRGIPTTDYPTPAQRPLNSRLDCTSFSDAFGIERPDWRASLNDVLKELSHVPA